MPSACSSQALNETASCAAAARGQAPPGHQNVYELTSEVEQLLSRAYVPLLTLMARVTFVSDLLNEQLGATTHVEENGGYIVRGVACPLAAITGKHPAVCHAMESLVTEIIGVEAHECCDRSERPKCCFEIKKQSLPRQPQASALP